jgi:N-acetylmuramoyl-L-alanine amidase CwlA
MKVQYGDACLSLQQVYEWPIKFINSISFVTDSPRPGQAHRVLTPEAIAAVETFMKENHCVTVNEITAHMDMSHESAHKIVHNVMQFHSVCKVGATPADCKIETTKRLCQPGTFETL